MLHKTPFVPPSFQKKKCFPSQVVLQTSTFYHNFNSFQSGWGVLYISNKYHPPNNLAKYQYFTLDTLYPSFISKKTGAPHRKHFLKHPLFDIFSPFLTLSEVCNISKKYWLPNKSATKIFLQKTPYAAPSLQQKICALHRASF